MAEGDDGGTGVAARSLSRWQVAAAAAFVVMALAQIAVPLTDDDRALTVAVITGFGSTTAFLTADRWGPRRAAAALGLVAIATLALERIGSTTGFPFGDYHYTDALQPQVLDVPVVVPVAWFAMGVPALVIGRRIARGPLAVVAGAVALTAWDLFLDPQMVDEGYWVWAVDGWYRGIPWSNYLGWLGSALMLLSGVGLLLPRDAAVRHDDAVHRHALAALYTWWAVMNTIGFSVFFGDPFVGLVGGVAMGTCALLAWRPVLRHV